MQPKMQSQEMAETGTSQFSDQEGNIEEVWTCEM